MINLRDLLNLVLGRSPSPPLWRPRAGGLCRGVKRTGVRGAFRPSGAGLVRRFNRQRIHYLNACNPTLHLKLH